MQSLFYVSESRIEADSTELEVRAIVQRSISRNSGLGVTGALLSTRRYFAQILEGDAAVLRPLMGSIEQDRRHGSLHVVDVASITAPDFGKWSMVHIAATAYVERRLERLLAKEGGSGAEEMRYMMVALAEG